MERIETTYADLRHHVAEAEMLLQRVEDHCSANYEAQTGEKKTDVLLAALVHAVLATVTK